MTTKDLRPDPLAFLGEELADLRNRHLYRPLRVMSSAQGPIVSVDERRLISLSSNDYLGLTHHPRLRAAAIRAVEDYGAGSGAVRTARQRFLGSRQRRSGRAVVGPVVRRDPRPAGAVRR